MIRGTEAAKEVMVRTPTNIKIPTIGENTSSHTTTLTLHVFLTTVCIASNAGKQRE